MLIAKHLSLTPGEAEGLKSAARAFNVEQQPQWADVARLSDRTTYESLRIYPEAAIEQQGTHLVPGRLSVRLNFDHLRPGTFSEGLPVHLEFVEDKAQPGRVVIKAIRIDTSKLTDGPDQVAAAAG